MKKRSFLGKGIITFIVGLLIGSFTFFWARPPLPSILMYHQIEKHPKNQVLFVSPENFSSQMKFLKEKDYKVISLKELAYCLQRGERFPKKSVLITFDDGYRNNYTNAYPVLKKYGFPATIFLIVKRIGKEGYLSYKEIEEMKNGGIDFGSHTLGHPNLTQISTVGARKEILLSKKILEKRLKEPIDFFCYPYGATNEKVAEIVRDSGYKMAFCTKGRGDRFPYYDLYTIPRIRVSSRDNLLSFRIKLSPFYSLTRRKLWKSYLSK